MRPSSNAIALPIAALLATLATAGCGQARQAVDGPGGVATTCTGCHGGLDNSSGAPPHDTKGLDATTSRSVGAHSAHLAAGVACSSCHHVPARAQDPAVPEHMDGVVQVPFGGVALLGGGTPPSFDPATGTCSNVYCHGAKLPAGAKGEATTPTWTGAPPTLLPAGTPAATPVCGACHGTFASNGAPSGHRAGLTSPACNACHPDTVAADGTLIPPVRGGRHADGHVDIGAAACTGCHGDASRVEAKDIKLVTAAPPADASGLTSGAKVGAHLRHVTSAAGTGSRLANPFQCTECHQPPSGFQHAGPPVVRFATAAGSIAATGGLTPQYSAGTCSNVYCHGASLPGGTASGKSPSWTGSYASASAECGTCHFAANPPADHPQVDKAGAAITATTQCSQCHPGTVNADGTINLSLGLHVNGTVEAEGHSAGWVAASQHGPAAKLGLSGCTACHGTDFGKDVGGGKSCNTCHANPATFIPGYTGATHPHWQTECTFCHGEPNRADVAGQDPVGTPAINAGKAAPPLGSQDESAPASNAVGAHLRHASDDATSGNRLAAAIKCQQCHGAALPVDVSHVDGQVVLGWQLAAQGTTPTPAAGRYPRSATSPTPVTCANYCHGATLVGGTFKTPSWTGAGTVGCGTCHGVPPDYAAAMSGGRGHHPPNASCGSCHAGSTAAAPARATHVNGTVDVVALACNSCHGGAANNAPPTDTTGGAVAARVGAHQAHVAGKTYTDGLGGNASCTECHGALPTSTGHANGVVDLAWGTIASTGSTPTPAAGAIAPASAVTCTNSCHNVKTASGGGTGGSLASVTWTGSITACNSCHAIPSSGGHHTSVGEHRAAACNKCHPAAYSSTTVDPTLHVNGIRNVTATGWNAANRSCGNNGTGCHGTSTKGPW